MFVVFLDINALAGILMVCVLDTLGAGAGVFGIREK